MTFLFFFSMFSILHLILSNLIWLFFLHSWPSVRCGNLSHTDQHPSLITVSNALPILFYFRGKYWSKITNKYSLVIPLCWPQCLSSHPSFFSNISVKYFTNLFYVPWIFYFRVLLWTQDVLCIQNFLLIWIYTTNPGSERRISGIAPRGIALHVAL